MPYLKPPTTADLKAIKQYNTDKMKSSWRKVALFLNAHRDINLTDWEKFALNKANKMTHKNTHDELEHLLRDFFTAAGKHFGLEQAQYQAKRRRRRT